MAKTYDFGTSDPVAAEGADFGQDDPPAARKELPAGVQPSEAGAGRGTADDPRRLDRNRSARIAEMDDATAPFSDPATVLARTPAPAPSAPGMPGVLERRIDRTLPEPVVTPQQEARNVELSRRAAAEDRGGPALRGGTHKPNRATGWGEEVARNAAEGFSETGTRAIAKAGAGIAEGAWGGVRAAADVAHEMGVPGAATVADVAKESAGAAGDFTSGMGKPRPLTDFAPNSVANYLREQGEGAASSLATSALFASTFGARAVIPLLSVQSAGQQYQAARQAGLDPAAALANAIPHGAFEAIGEKFQGLDKAARAMGVLMTRGAPREAIKSAGEVLIRAGVREIPGEVLTFLGQTGVDALPGIGIRRDLTVEQFVDGLRDVVVQSAMMGGAMGAGGAAATMRADRPREKTAEQLARDKGFLRREEQVKQLKAAGEKEIAAGMQRQVDAERADAELEVLAERPWGADPAFQEHFRQLRGQGTKPAEAAARAGMATAFTQVGEGLSIDAGVAKRAIDAAANLPLEKIPTFLDRFVANLVKKGLAQPAPDGTVAGAVAGVRDDAVQTAVGALYPDQNAAVDKIASLVGAEAPPTDTVAAITQLEQQQPATPDASIAESSTMIPATTEAPTAAGAAEVEAAAPAHFGIDDLTPNEHGAHQGASSPRNEKTATKEQILGGNAPLGHMKVGGMGASIENVAGSTREDKQNTPPKWSTPMAHGFHYGYFKRTEAADSTATKRQGIDAFIAEGIPEDYDGPVHVVDQVNKDGSFDEHKAVVADLDEKGARAAYLAHYEPGWTGLGAITRFDTFTDFKRWARDGKKTDPVGKITTQEAAAAAPDEAAARGSEGAAADAGADPAGAPAGGQPVAVTAPRKALSVGRTPQTAEPVTVRNGTVYVGKYEALDYDTSEPVRIADGASDEQVRQALKTAGVLTAKDRFFGGEQDAAAPAPAPTSQPLVQEQKQAKAGKNHSPLRAFLREVGVSPKLMSDLTGERNGFRAHGKLPNTFRAGGLGLDLLAQRAHQRGFLTDTDMEDDIMAGRKLVDMIHAELRGERVQPQSDGSAEERYEAMLEQRRQNEEAAARDLALTPEELEETGFTDADAVLQARVRELVEQANAAGLDVDAILEDAAKKDENATQDEYLAAAAQDVEAALARARSEGAQDRGEDPGRAGAEAPGRGAAEGVAQERFEAGRALSKEQRKAVLKTLTDVYKSKGAPREQKGIGRDGNERYGYVHSPDLFEKSDITGAMVRYYVKLPDGRIAHPSELFPDYTQADIDKAMIEQAAAERDDAAQQRITEERAAKHAADTRADAESSFMKRNPGFDLRDWRTGKTRSFVHFEKGGKFFAVTDDDAKHMERLERAGWTRAEAPAQDLLGDAPNPNQQAAATARAEREEAERKKAAAAPDAAEFVLSGSDRPADEAAARGQGDLLASAPERIEDLGEKIGGARKDTAESNGTKRSRSNDDDRPAWARRFKVSQTVRAGGQLNAPRDEGRWVINDSRSLDFMGQPKQVGRQTFATKEEAEAFVPIAAVALKHRVGMSSEGKYEIWREVSDRKRVKVVEQKFDDREAAQEYMVRHAVEIIETNTTFGEGDLPLPPDKRREGPQRRTGNVVGQDFIDTFGFRGVEFGNWNNQDERQNLMNDAYDGLMDLADVMGIPPKAIGLNGDLALAFGARGHGLHSARAHYELERAVINLTKEHGTGSLAHEWFHALDYYFGRQDGKASGEWVRNDDGTRTFKKVATEDAVSHGFGFKSKVRPEVRAAYEKVLETIFKKASKYVEDTDKADKFTARAREDLAQELDALRRDLSTPQSWKTRNNKPASAEQLAEFDTIAQRLLSGEAQAVATDWRSVETAKNRIATRWTNDSIEQLGAIFKAVRGRVGFDSTNRNGPLDRLASATRRYSDRLKMLADAQAGAEKTRMSPTDFAMNAKELDQGRGTDYWTTPHEMAARAFQAFVDDKIAERGGVSRFLNYAPERAGILTPWGVKFPFPRAAERTAINNVLQTLIDAIETKVTNSGVAMYARGLSMRDAVERVRGIRAASVAEVQAIVDEHTAGWKSGPRVHVVPTAADLPIAAPDDTRGLHLNGEVYVVASAHRADAGLNQRVAVTLAHEAIAHYGLRKILGPAAFKRFLGDIQLAIASGNKPLTEIRAYVRRTYRNDDGSYTLTRGQESDEIAARAVEMAVDDEGNFRPGFSWLKSVWARVAQFLRDLGLKVPFTNTELHGMLVLSMRGLERGHRVDSGGTVLIRGDKPAFMFAGPRAGIQAGTMDTLPEARRMDASGAAMKDIRAETGWFRGPHDKKWRFEIPDEGARLVGWADVAESKLFGETHKFKLGAILDHPELFRAYPDARDIDVVKRAGFLDLGGLQGWFDGKNDMGVTPYAKEPLSTLLHEVQHWVQSREGFATGGNQNMVFDAMTQAQKERLGADVVPALEKRIVRAVDDAEAAKLAIQYRTFPELRELRDAKERFHELAKTLESGDPKRMVAFDAVNAATDRMHAKVGGPGKRYFDLSDAQRMAIVRAESALYSDADLVKKVAAEEKAAVELQQLLAGVQSGDQAALKKALDVSGEAHTFYRRIAGEIEARDVQARHQFTVADREENEPFTSEAFDPADVITTFEKGEGNESRVDAREFKDSTPQQERELEPWQVANAAPLATALRRWSKGRADDQQLAAAVRAELDARKARRDAATDADRVRGSDWLQERLLRARRTGELQPGQVDLALWVLNQAPQLATGLGISIRSGDMTTPNGIYNTAARVVTIFADKATDDTATHEILHHTERMLPPQVQAGIRREWLRQLERGVEKAKRTLAARKTAPAKPGWTSVDTLPDADLDGKRLQLLDMMLAAARNGDADVTGMLWAGKGMEPGVDLKALMPYELSQPSEFWAVNGAALMRKKAEAHGDWIAKAKLWLRGLIERAKELLRLPSDAPVLRGLRAVLEGDGSVQSREMISRQGATFEDASSPEPDDAAQPDRARPLSRWRDATGRLQFAPGQALYDLIGSAADPLLARLLMKPGSPELRRAMRAMRLEVAKAQEVAASVAGEANKLSADERQMVSDIIEKEAAADVVPPEHAVRMATLVNDVMGRQTDELVRLGMLELDSAEKWRGQYLPRFYESKLTKKAADAWADALRMGRRRPNAMKGISGKHLRGRGMYETIPESQLEQYETMGWEVRDPDYTPGLPSTDGTVQVWRDFTRAEREKMGEIRDAGFRFVMGYMQTQRDIALGRMFEAIASNSALSARTATEKFDVQVPTTNAPGTGAKTYGKLAGRWVSKDTLSQLSAVEEAQSDAWQLYRKAMGLWKEGKTALNPVSHVNNVVSNVTMAHFAGVSYWDMHKYLGAARDFATKAGMVAEAKEAGLFLGTVSDAELANLLPPELRTLAMTQESTATKAGRTVFNLMTFFLRRPMGLAYRAEDLFFRYLIYRDARAHGADPTASVEYAQRFIFTYDDLPKGARRIRDFVLPFFSYTYKAVPALLHTALTHPLRFAAPAAVLWGVNAMAYAIAFDEDDDWREALRKYLTDDKHREKVRAQEQLEREHLPPWMKGTTALLTPKTLRLGQDELTKLPVFIDMARVIPGGDIFDVSPNAGGLPLPQPITPSHPLFTTAMAMLGNRDLFTGKDLVDSNDTRGEASEKRAGWLWRQTMPAITAGNYHWQRGMQALAQATGHEATWMPDALGGDATGVGRDGLPVQPKYAAMQTFGIKARPIDIGQSEDIAEGMKAKMIRDIDAELRRLKRLYGMGAIGDRAFDRETELASKKKERLREGLTIDGDKKE